MADTVGSGMIGSAIRQDRQIGQTTTQLQEQKRSNIVRQSLAKEELGERKRSNLVNEALSTEQVANQGRQVDVAERSADLAENQAWLKNYQELGPMADQKIEGLNNAYLDLEEKMSGLLEQRSMLMKHHAKAYGEEAAQSLPDIAAIDKKLAEAQGAWSAVSDQAASASSAKLLVFNSVVDPEEMIRRQYSPYELAQMNPLELTELEESNQQQIKFMTDQRKGLEEEYLKRSFRLEAEREGAVAGAKSRATFPQDLALVQARGQASGAGSASGSYLNQEAAASRFENLGKSISALNKGREVFGQISGDLSTQVKKMEPTQYNAEMYGPADFDIEQFPSGQGVYGFMKELSEASGNQKEVRRLLSEVDAYSANLSPESPLMQVYDFFKTINSKWGKKDVPESLQKVMTAWKTPLPSAVATPTSSNQ